MVRRRQNSRRKPGRVRRYNGPVASSRLRTTVHRSGLANGGFLTLYRIVSGLLPLGDKTLQKVFEIAFNFIAQKLSSVNYYTGAYSQILLTPGTFLRESPLLATDTSGSFTFPAHPVSLKWMKIKLINTVEYAIRPGRWAAVIIPFREIHDADHYKVITDKLSFEEVAAMPFSQVRSAREDLVLMYRMRGAADYCARPRELTESVALLYIVWDDSARPANSMKETFTGSDFSCNVELAAGMQPHVLFGPRRRVTYPSDTFNVKCLTLGDKVRLHHPDGRVEFQSIYDDEFDMCADPQIDGLSLGDA